MFYLFLLMEPALDGSKGSKCCVNVRNSPLLFTFLSCPSHNHWPILPDPPLPHTAPKNPSWAFLPEGFYSVCRINAECSSLTQICTQCAPQGNALVLSGAVYVLWYQSQIHLGTFSWLRLTGTQADPSSCQCQKGEPVIQFLCVF